MFKRLLGLLYWYMIGRSKLIKHLNRRVEVQGWRTVYEKNDIKIKGFCTYLQEKGVPCD